MVNALIAFKTLDETKFKSEISTIQKSIDNLIVEKKITHIVSPVFHQFGTLVGWVSLTLKIIFLQMTWQIGF